MHGEAKLNFDSTGISLAFVTLDNTITPVRRIGTWLFFDLNFSLLQAPEVFQFCK